MKTKTHIESNSLHWLSQLFPLLSKIPCSTLSTCFLCVPTRQDPVLTIALLSKCYGLYGGLGYDPHLFEVFFHFCTVQWLVLQSAHTHIWHEGIYVCIPAVTKSKGDGLNRGPHVQADLFWSHFFNSVWADAERERQNTHSQLLCIFLWLLSWHSHWFFWPLYHHGWWIESVRLTSQQASIFTFATHNACIFATWGFNLVFMTTIFAILSIWHIKAKVIKKVHSFPLLKKNRNK